MAAVSYRNENRLSLEIRTKSIEQTLIPLVTQITTLVNHKEKPIKSERTLRALEKVGHAVNLAVEQFYIIGETIAKENSDIQHEMCEACKEAKHAGVSIQKLTVFPSNDTVSQEESRMSEKASMVKAARQLLSAITRVLIIADKVVVKQLIAAKDKVSFSLARIEQATDFKEFVKYFSHFGGEMVDLAHLTGERQNDLKSDKHRAQMGIARSVLEKSTMMLLTTSKTLLRHPECPSARSNREGVLLQMRRAMELIHQAASPGSTADGVPGTPGGANDDILQTPPANGDSGISLASAAHPPTASRAIQDFEELVEMTRVTLVGPSTEERLQNFMETMVDAVQEFTDSPYTSNQNRERILLLCDRTRHELNGVLSVRTSNIPSVKKDGSLTENTAVNQQLETAILRTREASRHLKKQLHETVMEQASELFKLNEDAELLAMIKSAALSANQKHLEELNTKFKSHSDQLQEVCKLLRHISATQPLKVWTGHTENMLKYLGPQTIDAARTLALYNSSKMVQENFDVFADSWASQINELSVLVKDINDTAQQKTERQVYMSLPRPGRHGVNTRNLLPVKLSTEEQSKISKLGLDMKLMTAEMEAEAEKWQHSMAVGASPDSRGHPVAGNAIVWHTRQMSGMAYSMYLFTRGEGMIKTTQDLFTQAEYFAEEGAKLFKSVKDFLQLVPTSPNKTELSNKLDRLPILCQRLIFSIKSPTVGKAGTFNKVDAVIQDTKNLMNAAAATVTLSFACANKHNIDYRSIPQSAPLRLAGQSSLESAPCVLPSVGSSGTAGSDTSDRESVRSGRSFRSSDTGGGAVTSMGTALTRSASLNRHEKRDPL